MALSSKSISFVQLVLLELVHHGTNSKEHCVWHASDFDKTAAFDTLGRRPGWVQWGHGLDHDWFHCALSSTTSPLFPLFFLVLFPHLPYHHSLYISELSNGSSTFSIWIICFYAYKYIPFSINQTQKKRCFLTPAMLSISVYDLHSFVLLIWFQNEPLSFHFIPVDLSYLSQWHCLAAESLSTHTNTLLTFSLPLTRRSSLYLCPFPSPLSFPDPLSSCLYSCLKFKVPKHKMWILAVILVSINISF